MDELLSVVIPAYNAAEYIEEAITSILEQKTCPVEVIVVNDGSTDDTATRAAVFGPPVTVLVQENQGIFDTLNTGVRAARGKWLAFLDADDLWSPGRLEKQFAAIQAKPTLACVYGQMQNFYSPDTDAEYRKQVVCESNPLPGLWYHTLLVRREDFLRVGLFRTEWKLGAYIEWFERATTLGLEYTILPDVLLMRRLHPSNSGLRESASQSDYARILKVILDRKRARRGVVAGDR